MERDVVTRIRLLRDLANALPDKRLADKMANDLILPNIQLLAEFCESVDIEGE